ncbi:FADL397C-Ap [Eremothecium gossypii FDAG1]|nr:FADL397C-Ap [Eremothecium gossypii FDAG1]
MPCYTTLVIYIIAHSWVSIQLCFSIKERYNTTMTNFLYLVTAFISFASVALTAQSEKEAAAELRSLMSKEKTSFLNTITATDGRPFSLVHYHVSTDRCEGMEKTGEPILIVVDKSPQSHSIRNNGPASFSINDNSIQYKMNGVRSTFYGSFEEQQPTDELKKCFLSVHPDSQALIPGFNPKLPTRFYKLKISGIFNVPGAATNGYRGAVSPSLYAAAVPA